MKIRAIVCASNDHRHTAFRAEPVATEEVVEFALKNYLGETVATEYSIKDGLFIDSASQFETKWTCWLISRITGEIVGLSAC
jgi:hypothetical protein